jgi:iron complex outermembrane receptor protein
VQPANNKELIKGEVQSMGTLNIRSLVTQILRGARNVSPAPALCLLAMAGSAAAQQAPAPGGAAATGSTDNLEEIVVTGIRKSIEDAVTAKKQSSSIIEEVSAEDIGKLPDASIAESIARLPGIAAQRTNGRAQTLAIRGLGPDFTVTTLNGREQASVNDNRTVEFDQYPAELVAAVKIFKTPDAGMAYQGIAGTADIETVRPLSYGQAVHALGYQRDQDAQKTNVPGYPRGGNRVNGMYIDQFFDNTFGVAFGAAYNKTPYQAQTREPWGYATIPNNEEVIGGDKDGVKSAYYERTGVMGVLEYKPNDYVHMVLDGYHSDFKELQAIRRMEYGTIWAGATLSQIGSTEPDPVAGSSTTTRVTSGQFTNVPFLVVENYNNDRRAHLDSLGLNTEIDPADKWSINNDLSWSRVKRTDLRLESTAGLGRNDSTDPSFLPPPETVGFTTDTSTGVTHLTTQNNYSNYNTTFLTDPGNWGGGPTRSGYLGHPTVEDELKGVKLAVTRKLGDFFLSDVSFGANYAERTKSKDQWQSTLYLQGGASHVVVPTQYRDGIINTSFFGNPYGMINYDAYGLYNSGFWHTVDSRLDPNANYGDVFSDYTNTWKVTEKLTTAFVKVDIDTQVWGVPLTGNVGVQTVTTDQSSVIFFAAPATTGNIVTGQYDTVGAKYTDVLPSMNLAFGLPDDIKLRVAAAKVEARPRMDDLAGGASFSTIADSQAPYSAPNGKTYYWTQSSGGNPKLRPWRANAYDISVEKYFSTRAYVSAAVFYKELTTYITPQFVEVDFTGVPLPLPQPGLTYTKANANRLGIGKISANGSGGYIRGAELAASLPLDVFTSVLEGFGVQLSASWNQSSISPDPGVQTTVPGLSPRVINSTLFYERAGFSVRVSDRYRGGFVGEVPAYDGSLTINDVHAENVVDAQIGYSFTEGHLNGLSVNLSGSNLTDQPFVLNQVGSPSKDIDKYEKYGAVYAINVRYKF